MRTILASVSKRCYLTVPGGLGQTGRLLRQRSRPPKEPASPPTRANSEYAALSSSQLLQAVASSNAPAAWEEFVHRFHPFLTRLAARVGRRFAPSPVEATEDLIQGIYWKLCSRGGEVLARFRPSHPDSGFAFLRVVAVHYAIDTLRARESAKRGGEVRSLVDTDAEWLVHDGGASADLAERGVLLRENR